MKTRTWLTVLPMVIAAVIALGLFFLRNAGAVDSSKLTGSWEIDGIGAVMMGATITNSIYTFEPDGSFTMTYQAPDGVFGQVGTWELHGNLLITSLTEYVFSPTNREPMVPALITKQRITALDENGMVWKAFPVSRGFKLKRVAPTGNP
jgi:hypothetical protein